ncbi:DUF3604 domain-containing protein [Shimia sediminis]|uniref:DUF3604 domain-containing protein n=1 Tax=Shimia sediminis TaxID=2497945 RepID=UPI001F192A64|nr:DUF3604 domain-containing protein [Shimia sediminis]
MKTVVSGIGMLLLCTAGVMAQENSALGTDFAVSSENLPPTKGEYSPFVGQDFPNRVFWGDSHLHTSYSWDAGLVGARLDPSDAYRFARGEEVTASFGVRARLVRPLDWLVVADHAESLGVAQMIERADPRLLGTEVGRRTYELFEKGDIYGAFENWGLNVIVLGQDPLDDPEISRPIWEEITAYADAYNDPGAFTAFIGYEWSSAPAGNNLHRVVVYRDGAEKANRYLPFRASDSADPEDLWSWMETYETETGGRMLAIPHNGNISNGVMFSVETLSGEPMDADYAERRSRYEPLYEVTQMKGDGEAHPLLSPDDDFADYGTWDGGNWNGEAKTPEMLPNEYARSALKLGLQLEQDLGVNPFNFGLVGATDSHTGLATSREDNNFGKVALMEPSDNRFDDQIVPDPQDTGTGTYEFETLASGLQGVWARENTRKGIFDAMRQKETYATTGSRITVRVFAGWDFEADDVLRPDFAQNGYARGVPMGGDMRAHSEGAAPRLMIRALRDPDGANLDRIQVVKGWLDAAGELQEVVVDVACSDDRKIVEQRCDGPVGNTVDIASAKYTNDIGDVQFMAHWEDPDFDPAERAFYYVRVLEIPTPRWTTYDAAFFGVELPEGVPATQQDRAYTSPIWYSPRG